MSSFPAELFKNLGTQMGDKLPSGFKPMLVPGVNQTAVISQNEDSLEGNHQGKNLVPIPSAPQITTSEKIDSNIIS